MFAVERLGSYITRGVNTVSGPFHPFGGAVDIVVVEQQDGTFKSSPWYVRFGKFQGVLKAKEKIVNIAVDGVEANFNMYLDHKGVAYFHREIDDADEVDSLLWPSSSGEDADTQYHDRRPLKSKSCNYETAQPNLVNEIVVNHGKILSRTSSRRSKILGLVFGRKSMKGRSNDGDGNNADFVRTDSLERAEIAANLLDVRWSTNLGKESAPHFRDSDISKGLDDSEDNGTSMFENSCDTDNLSWTSFQKLERPVEETGVEMSCIGRSALGQSSDLEHSYEEDNMVSLEADVLKENGSNEAIICCDTFKNSRIGSDDIEAVDGSTELISESEIISSTGSNVDQVNDCANSNCVCEEVESKKLVSTLDPVCDPQGPEEEHFLFSDGEDFTVRESFVLDFEAESSPDKLEEVIQVSKMTSGNVDIPIKDKVSRKQVGRVVKSLPNLGSRINEHHPLYGHSLDSITKSSKWMMIRKDLSNCVELARDEVQILSNSSEPSTKDAQALKNSLSTAEAGKIIESPSGRWGLWPFKRSRTIAVSQSTSRDFNAFESINRRMEAEKVTPIRVGNKKKIRTKIPTSEQLASLNLKEGRNIVTFTFSTAMLGEQQVDARIYLWRWDARIVISDVDGTITKSDLLGQFMPLVGRDWSQTGVANLFSAIKENGYQMLFLSARAISQAYLTRQFLFNLKQDGKALPDGPVVISPDGLFPSLFREVIRRAPHEFKIACLEDIKALFPPDRKPFYAGFGNRDTDEFSYLKVGIPKGKIFIINPKGEVVVNRRVDSKSYTSLKDIVHDMFPPRTSSEQEDFNSWNFWKLPPPDIIC